MIKLLNNLNLEGFKIVVSSVCVGNVGQLACDILIYSLNLKKLGHVWHPSILPLAGPDPYHISKEPAIGCEFYVSMTLKLIVLLIRSAVMKTGCFLETLVPWLKNNKVKQVIILAGSFAHERRDKQLRTKYKSNDETKNDSKELINKPLRFVFCPLTSKEEAKRAKSRNWIELESKTGLDRIDLSDDKPLPYISGAGLSVKLFNKCMKNEIPCSILLCFCSEGDNIFDALKLVDYLNEWIPLKDEQKIENWMIPPSWSLLFGSGPPIEIFN